METNSQVRRKRTLTAPAVVANRLQAERPEYSTDLPKDCCKTGSYFQLLKEVQTLFINLQLLQYCSLCLSILHNYFNNSIKLFPDLYINKFLNTSAKIVLSMYDSFRIHLIFFFQIYEFSHSHCISAY